MAYAYIFSGTRKLLCDYRTKYLFQISGEIFYLSMGVSTYFSSCGCILTTQQESVCVPCSPKRSRRFSRWRSTVFTLMNSLSAVCGLVRPQAPQSSTSASRRVMCLPSQSNASTCLAMSLVYLNSSPVTRKEAKWL